MKNKKFQSSSAIKQKKKAKSKMAWIKLAEGQDGAGLRFITKQCAILY